MALPFSFLMVISTPIIKLCRLVVGEHFTPGIFLRGLLRRLFRRLKTASLVLVKMLAAMNLLRLVVICR